MKSITTLLSLLAIASVTFGCAHKPSDQTRGERILVDVEPEGGSFTTRFTFPIDAPIWAFHRSALRRDDRLPWRNDSWSVSTLGVELTRIDNHDVLVNRSGGAAPRNTVIGFTPAAVDLIADYDPALKFSDGTVAVFSGVFSAFPANDRNNV